MNKKIVPVICLTLFLLTGQSVFADNCPNAFVSAMQQEDLEEERIISICKRLARLSESSKPEITVDQIEKDITGKMVQGWIFRDYEWRDIDILSSTYSEEKAKIEINVDTIRNKSGTLRLRYRWTDSGWRMVRIFNVDFE